MKLKVLEIEIEERPRLDISSFNDGATTGGEKITFHCEGGKSFSIFAEKRLYDHGCAEAFIRIEEDH